MSFTDIIEELPRLSSEEREAVFRRLVDLDDDLEAEEASAIDAGIQSLGAEPRVSLAEARSRMARWLIN